MNLQGLPLARSWRNESDDPVKAMILAAGLGTRLRPLTNDRPKALVTVAGRTLLEITIERLRSFGVDEIVINTHYFAEKIVNYLAQHHDFRIRIEVMHEDVLLDTGGGLKNAAAFFRRKGSDAPFLLHNVDVMSGIDLGQMVAEHRKSGALATLAVQHRKTSRSLLVNAQGELCGRRSGNDEKASDAGMLDAVGFCGIHVLSARIFNLMTEQGKFSIIDSYLRLSAAGEVINTFNADGAPWRDLGRIEDLQAAEAEAAAARGPAQGRDLV